MLLKVRFIFYSLKKNPLFLNSPILQGDLKCDTYNCIHCVLLLRAVRLKLCKTFLMYDDLVIFKTRL